jgi:UDP-N-acetylglucosamine:LPS N-acetylglucosamine transferase
LIDIKILVLGGSQAAKVFAEKLPKIFEKLKILKYQLKFINNVKMNKITII